jgi:hypothetical protein
MATSTIPTLPLSLSLSLSFSLVRGAAQSFHTHSEYIIGKEEESAAKKRSKKRQSFYTNTLLLFPSPFHIGFSVRDNGPSWLCMGDEIEYKMKLAAAPAAASTLKQITL